MFVNVPLISDPTPKTPPVIEPVTDGAVQEYVVPLGTVPFVEFTGVELNATPVHAVFVIAVILGFGFIVAVNVYAAPAHEPAVGVTVYVAV